MAPTPNGSRPRRNSPSRRMMSAASQGFSTGMGHARNIFDSTGSFLGGSPSSSKAPRKQVIEIDLSSDDKPNQVINLCSDDEEDLSQQRTPAHGPSAAPRPQRTVQPPAVGGPRSSASRQHSQNLQARPNMQAPSALRQRPLVQNSVRANFQTNSSGQRYNSTFSQQRGDVHYQFRNTMLEPHLKIMLQLMISSDPKL